MEKISNKGFTLIEMLAAIVILSLLATFTFVLVTNAFDKSKEKAEEAFYKQVENYVEDYISLSGSKLKYKNGVEKEKCHVGFDKNEVCETITLYSSDLGFEDVMNTIVGEMLVNPSSKVECSNSNTNLTIYRDSDFVYCFKLVKEGTDSCINNTIDTCSSIYR